MKVFIDGSTGTTGLSIRERLAVREGIELITLEPEERHIAEKRREALNSADAAFLCLPDAAAIEAASFVVNPNTVVFDTSTAHRTAPGWSYGFPELGCEYEQEVATSKRIAVPGCHASGFIALIKPLIKSGLISPDEQLSCFSLTGYSGGGKKMIAEYESEERSPLLNAPRHYALSQQHKHLREMTAISGIKNSPAFCPVVASFYSGMLVTVSLFSGMLLQSAKVADIKSCYKNAYGGSIVRYTDDSDEQGFLSASALSGKDSMEISVFGNEERIVLAARYDNLGKGACGAALECMNIAFGLDKATGLNV